MESNLSLDEIGVKYNTGKASLYKFKSDENAYKGHDYLKRYEIFLKELKDEIFTMVELGGETGASLKMWKEYFPYARIFGVDLNPNLENLNEERIKIICSDATAEDLPEKINNYDNIKLIVDDCSHAWGDQRRSFEMLFPLLESGGYYIIEDLECGTMGAYANHPPKIQDAQVFFDYATDRMKILRVSENRDQVKYRPFFDQLPQHIQNIELSLDMAIMIPGAVIFRKK